MREDAGVTLPYTYSTSALEGGWSTPRITPGKGTWYQLYRRLGGPRDRSGWVRQFSPPANPRPFGKQTMPSQPLLLLQCVSFIADEHCTCHGMFRQTSDFNAIKRHVRCGDKRCAVSFESTVLTHAFVYVSE